MLTGLIGGGGGGGGRAEEQKKKKKKKKNVHLNDQCKTCQLFVYLNCSKDN
jgi:hypothetical protein